MVRRRTGLWVALVCGVICAQAGRAASFRRGDANGDASVNVSDAVGILDSLFSFAGGPDCVDALDVNDDGSIDISDSVYLLLFLFSGGNAPTAPIIDVLVGQVEGISGQLLEEVSTAFVGMVICLEQ